MPVIIPARRIREWETLLKEAEEFARSVARKLAPATVILHGSVVRGDFNLGSDIDVIVVSPRFRGTRPLDRYELFQEEWMQAARVEPLPWTPEELERALESPSWREALRRGYVLLRDDIGLVEGIVEKTGARSLRIALAPE